MFEIQTIDTLPSSDAHQLLVDRAAITDVTIRYCWALDTKDWAVLDSVFTEDANGDLLEDVVDERVHDGHRLGGDTGVRVHLLEHLVDVWWEEGEAGGVSARGRNVQMWVGEGWKSKSERF